MEKSKLILEFDAFMRSFKQNTDTSHAFLLGAGTSVSSGIQSASDCIWEWKKDIYTSKNPNSATYFTNYKSDTVRDKIQKWLDNLGDCPKLNSPEEYSHYAEMAFPIEDDRRKYFQHLSEDKEPYVGYKLLCLLNKAGIAKSVWSTNFDGLIERAAHQMNITPISINLDNSDRIFRNESSNEFLYIALHGDYKYSSLKNTTKELDSQNLTFENTLKTYLSNKNLIILGYSGRDASLMKALKLAYKEKGAGRIYWCGYGHEMSKEVESLLIEARNNGREAFYVPTDGFDKTIIHLCKTCFEGKKEYLDKIESVLKSVPQEIAVTPFKIDSHRVDKYIKSNLHPIVFPKEVFLFEIKYNEDEKPWQTLREIIGTADISAVPFKGKIYAISTITIIKSIFGERIISNIVRTPISVRDIKNVHAFQSLFLNATIKGITKSTNLNSNGRFKIWSDKLQYLTNTKGVESFEGVELSLSFEEGNKFAYISFKPTLYFEPTKGNLTKDFMQSASRSYLEKLFNDKYDAKLEQWNNIIFNKSHLIFEFPVNSASGLKFAIAKATAFATIKVLDANFKAYKSNSFNDKQALHKGIQFLEPQLIFTNTNNDSPFRDFHPMRGLSNHKPYDVLYNGKVFPENIQLGIICPNAYADTFYNFLQGLNNNHVADRNTDYLINYPGFQSIYNLPIEIPMAGSNKWEEPNFIHTSDSIKNNAVNLSRYITSKIETLANKYTSLVVTIFIPNEWEAYRHFEDDGEVFDLHDYIKAFAAQRNITTQLIEESTLSDSLKCQIYWWLSLSFYVKSLRTPWVLSNSDAATAYAGIGYSVKKSGSDSKIVLGCSHIYDSLGQGLKYRLSKVEDCFLDNKNNPYLSYDEAFRFGVTIRELFMDSMNNLPKRVVVHKRTPFKQDEINGIVDSLTKAGVNQIDLIEINFEYDIRYMATNIYKGNIQIDKFPISRGTCILFSKNSALLWTHGIVPSVKNPNYKYYLGGRSIPQPLRITKHYGDGDINTIATEILGLTKMNWNSFDLYTKLPATIDSSNTIARIGTLLSRVEGYRYDYRCFI